jgi:hypothetical protein
MMRVELDGWVLECNVEATRQAYVRVADTRPKQCDCLYCRNFAAARSLAYPAEALALYSQVGISPHLEAEVYELGPAVSGSSREYGGWHHFVGHVVSDPTRKTRVTPSFEMWFHEARDLAAPAFVEQPLVQVEFLATVPWVLGELPDDWPGQQLR